MVLQRYMKLYTYAVIKLIQVHMENTLSHAWPCIQQLLFSKPLHGEIIENLILINILDHSHPMGDGG